MIDSEDQLAVRDSKSGIENLRILLWDIDGTLLGSNRAGAYKEYFIPTLEKVYGTAGRLAEMQVAGMTDTQIAYEALMGEGFEIADIFSKINTFIYVLGQEMNRVISRSAEPYGVLPGIRQILTETRDHPEFVNSLLTGNLSSVAEAKLRRVDLWEFFDGAPRAFGEVSHIRSELVYYAAKQFSDFLQIEIEPRQFIIIGDTPNDIACARDFGANVMAVGTGRNHGVDDLAKFEPDFLLEDLADTDRVLKILASI